MEQFKSKIIGWAPAMNRWHDQTGSCHAVQTTITGRFVPACNNKKIYALGYLSESLEDCKRNTSTHACSVCLSSTSA